ncbi:hypothetical protein [Paenibacillus amylolyticus]|uniref:Uncharacterized protein n=1 Tax=Paenibacillus amylolyticus TaxID=1451 RepID=A0ABD8B2P2_PAEAM
MTKEELIQIYNELHITGSGPILSNTFLILAGVTYAITLISMTLIILSQGDRGEEIYEFIFKFGSIAGVLCCLYILAVDNRGTSKFEQRQNIFYTEYLTTQEKSKEIVRGEPNFQPDGTLSAILDTDKPIAVATSISQVTYTDEIDSYIKSIWVDGLTEYDIPDGFYEIELYLSDKKEMSER